MVRHLPPQRLASDRPLVRVPHSRAWEGGTRISDDPSKKTSQLVKKGRQTPMRKLSKVLRNVEITSGRGFFKLYGSTEGSMSKVASSAIFDSRRAMIASCAFGISWPYVMPACVINGQVACSDDQSSEPVLDSRVGWPQLAGGEDEPYGGGAAQIGSPE